MKTIYELILKKFLTSSLIPILMIELSLVAALFFLNERQNSQNREELTRVTLDSFESIMDEKTKAIQNSFLEAQKGISETKEYIEEFFNNPKNYCNPELKIQKKGDFYLNDEGGKSSIYTTNTKELTKEGRDTMERLSLCEPYLKNSIKRHGKLISSAWVNIGKYYALAYPYIDVLDSVPHDLDVTQYPFYYDVDKENNPLKQIKFSPTYNESWALELGEIGAYLAPLYSGEKFFGVVGYNITIHEILKILKETKLRYDAFLMLLDDQNNLIATSNDKMSFEEFGKYSYGYFYENFEKVEFNELQKIDMGLEKQEGQLLITKPIPNTNLKLILFDDGKKIYQNVESVFKKGQQLAYIAVLGIVIFYGLFTLYTIISTKKTAKKISEPIEELADYSSGLGTNESLHIKDSPISEINTLSKNLESANTNLTRLLIHDELTGLYNRRKLIIDLQSEASKNLILVDVDRFSHLNGVYGVNSGDEVLKELAKRVCEFVGHEKSIYKLEADRFVVLTQDEPSDSCLKELIKACSKDSIPYNGVDIETSVTLSVAKPCEVKKDQLLCAEIALEEAKKEKRGSYIFYSQEIAANREFENNILWGNKIKQALKEDRIVAYFQPILNIKTGKIEKFESLVRLIEDGKPVSPFKFLEPAKNVGLLPDITQRMIEKCFSAAKEFSECEFSINVSFSDFKDSEFFGFIKDALKKFDLNADRIVLEILETEAIKMETDPIEVINTLARMGFKIAVDDFGSGYSNYSHLLNMEVDFLKIDGEFIKNIMSDHKSEKITQAILEFSKLLQTKTIAEFVADEQIFEKIKLMGVDFAQGYHISPPVRPEEIIGLLSQKF